MCELFPNMAAHECQSVMTVKETFARVVFPSVHRSPRTDGAWIPLDVRLFHVVSAVCCLIIELCFMLVG